MEAIPPHFIDLMFWLIEYEGEYGFYYTDLDRQNPSAVFVDGPNTYLLSGRPFEDGYLFEL